MVRLRSLLRRRGALAASLGFVLLAAPAGAADLLPARADVPISVVVGESSNEAVSFQVTNHGTHAVRGVEVLVSRAFLWNDEFAPRPDNPSRATRVTVPGEIAPGESRQVTYELSPPLPERSDGRFTTVVEVLRFTEVLPLAGGSLRSTETDLQIGEGKVAP